MNNPHQGARLTVHSREVIVARRAEGRPVAQIAAEFGVSVRTVYKWLRRFREGGKAGLGNGASAPARSPRRLGEGQIALILDLRRRFRMTAATIARQLGLARATVARWLARHGLGRLTATLGCGGPRPLAGCQTMGGRTATNPQVLNMAPD